MVPPRQPGSPSRSSCAPPTRRRASHAICRPRSPPSGRGRSSRPSTTRTAISSAPSTRKPASIDAGNSHTASTSTPTAGRFPYLGRWSPVRITYYRPSTAEPRSPFPRRPDPDGQLGAGPRSAGAASSAVRSPRPPKGATLKSRPRCSLMRFLHPSRSDPLPEKAGRRCPTQSRTTPRGGIETVIHPGRAAALGYSCATSSLPLLKPTTTDFRNLPGGSAATTLPAHRIPRQGRVISAGQRAIQTRIGHHQH